MADTDPQLPSAPIDRLTEPVSRFLHVQSASGIVLLLLTVLALALANSPWSAEFLAFWKTPVGFSVGDFQMLYTLKHWINDGLMAIFFFLVGLEVKRELVLGELRDFRSAALPLAAALGGMVAPALIYLALQRGEPGERGWGIPMATDIAFVVGCLAVLGSRVPKGLRVLLLSLAIIDDIGAILVIAVGYSADLNLLALGLGFAGIVLVTILQRVGVRSVPVYVIVGMGIWFAFHESGVHATIAGVILGLMTPVRPWVDRGLLADMIDQMGDFLHGGDRPDDFDRQAAVKTVARAATETISPLERLETALHPWVSFLIMPLFAFANAGVPFELELLTSPVSLAVIAGLFVGKPVGIVLLSYLAVATGVAKLPAGISWKMLAAGGVLSGIGFTMSIFIAGLALNDDLLSAAKVGILLGSTLAAVLGMVLLLATLPRATAAAAET